MDKTLIRAAQDGLAIVDVVLRSSRCELSDGFDPRYMRASLDVQVMQRVDSSQVLEIAIPGHAPGRLFRVFVTLGIRWIEPVATGGKRRKKASSTEPEPVVRANIETTFAADYQLLREVDKSALDEFALYNAPFNVWPFWREYVSTQSSRMGLPRTVIPLNCLSVAALPPRPSAEASSPSPEGGTLDPER